MQSIPANAEAISDAWTETLHNRIAVSREPVAKRKSLRRLEIDDDIALIAVDGEKDCPDAILERGPEAGVVTAERLDLDDVGAQIGEVLRAQRPGQDFGKVQNPATRKRTEVTGAGNLRGDLFSPNPVSFLWSNN